MKKKTKLIHRHICQKQQQQTKIHATEHTHI